MEERTADEIAAIFSAAGDSVTLINADANYTAYKSRTEFDDTEAEWKEMIKRNTDHLAQQREQLWISLHETNGAMKILELQILETEPEPNQQLNIKEQDQQSKKAPSKK